MLETTAKKVGYESYKDSGVDWLGEVPEHWDLTRLGTRFKERKTKVSDKDFPPLSVTKNGTIPQLASAAKSNDGDNRKLVKKGDFVINSRSDRKGSSGIAYQDGSVSLIYIVMEPLNIHPIYCNCLLKSYNFIEEFYRMGHGIVADLWTTRYDEMKAIMVGIPPLKEQTAIAQFLDDKTTKIEEAIAIKEQQIQLLKERKQILIHKAVTNGLDDNVTLKDSGVEWLGEIPEHWNALANKFIFNLKKNQVGKKSSEYDLLSLTLRGIIVRNLEDGGKFPAEFDTYQEVKKGDFVFCLFDVEETPRCVGLSGYDGMITGAYTVMEPNENFDRSFLYYFYLNLDADKRMKPLYTGLRNTISKDNFFAFKTFVPPLQEQTAIAQFLDDKTAKIETAINLKQEEIAKLKEYKSSLINSVVTGKVKVC